MNTADLKSNLNKEVRLVKMENGKPVLDAGGQPVTIPGFFLKNEILFVDLRWTKDRNGKFPWGRNKSTGLGADSIVSWLDKLASMKRMFKTGELLKKGVFASFFPERVNILGSDKPFAVVADQWQTDALPKRTNKRGELLSPSTKYYYGVFIENTWKKSFSDGSVKNPVSWPISAITKDRIEHVLHDGALAGCSAKTKADQLSVLRMILAFALKKGYITENPVDQIETIKRKKLAVDVEMAFRVEEIEPFLDMVRAEAMLVTGQRKAAGWQDPALVGELIYNHYDFAFSSGLRPEEMIELQRRDIRNPSLIDCRRSRVSVPHQPSVSKPNKDGLARVIRLTPRAKAAIQRQLKVLDKLGLKQPTQPIFISPQLTQHIDLQLLGDLWNAVADKLWEPKKNRPGETKRIRVRPQYATRHTSVSLQLMIGERARTVAKQHGHTEQTLEKDYAHWMDLYDADGDDSAGLLAIYRFYGMTPPSELAHRQEVNELKRLLAEAESRSERRAA